MVDYLSREINTLSNRYWTHFPIRIEYLASENYTPFFVISKIYHMHFVGKESIQKAVVLNKQKILDP